MSYPVIKRVSLYNLKENLSKIKTLVGSKTKVFAVVKANAYGHGIIGVSNAVYSMVDGFCVSLVKEALDLRFSGIDKEILLLTPIDENYLERLIEKDITLTITSKRDAILLDGICSGLNKRAKVHIKLNTGMNRLGLSSVYEVNEVLSIARRNNFIITGVYSHLGDAKNKKYANFQRENFIKLSSYILDEYPMVTMHLSSSAGILLGEKFYFDMVRVGLSLYGYTPFETNLLTLSPAMKVYAKTLLVREKIKSERLLYGSKKYRFDKVTLLRVGYADGFFRSGDQILPPRCMDLSVVLGAHFENYYCVMDNAQSLAKKYKTIPYEILTQFGSRAEIIYE